MLNRPTFGGHITLFRGYLILEPERRKKVPFPEEKGFREKGNVKKMREQLHDIGELIMVN